MNLKHKPGISFRIGLVLTFFLIAGSLIVLNGSMIYADDEKESEEIAQKIKELEIITIDNKGYKKDRKDPAKLDHVKHAREYKISCWECHHEYNDEQQAEQAKQVEQTEEAVQNEQPKPRYLTEENIWSPWGETKKCSECHDPKEKKNDVMKLQAAYHKNCKTCHKEKRIYGNDVLAYRKCTSCHK